MKISCRHRIAGVLLGCIVAGIVLGVWAPRRNRPADPGWQLLAECAGALEDIVIHYTPEAADAVMPVYRGFLSRLAADVTVRVVCHDRKDFEQFEQAVGHSACRLAPVVVGHLVTCWSRDRWLVLEARGRRGSLLVAPWAELGADCWPARAGDQQVAEDLAAGGGSGISARSAAWSTW